MTASKDNKISLGVAGVVILIIIMLFVGSQPKGGLLYQAGDTVLINGQEHTIIDKCSSFTSKDYLVGLKNGQDIETVFVFESEIEK